MFGKLESIVSSALGLSSSPRSFSRRGFLYATGISALAAACGGSSGGSSSDDNNTPSDTTAPGQINDLEVYASSQAGETAGIEFTVPGDDGFSGKPEYLRIRASASPIETEQDWYDAKTVAVLFNDADFQASAGTYFSREFDLSQVQELVDNNLNHGELYFAVRAGDEAGNEGELSNPAATGSDHTYIKSKAEFYVDKWLAPGGFDLNYDESFLVHRGDSTNGIDSNVDALAQILVNADDNNDCPISADDPDCCACLTWQEIRDILLSYTDGQPVVAGNAELIDASDATKLNSFMKYACQIEVYDPDTGGTTIKTQAFNNLTQNEWDDIYNMHRNALIQIVSAFPENYGNLDPSYDPDW